MPSSKYAMCPKCGCTGEFPFLGVQQWPPDVAEKFGLPASINLYGCPCCTTTISEPNLLSIPEHKETIETDVILSFECLAHE